MQTSDKAVVEEFEEPAKAQGAVSEVVCGAVSPASEIGGDAGLIVGDEGRIKSEVAEHDGLVSLCLVIARVEPFLWLQSCYSV